MISCASVSDRIHSPSSNCFEVSSFSFFKNMSCVLRRNRHSSSKSPVAHFIVRMSSPRNKHLLWPGPANETMASRCSCSSPVDPGALMGASLTCGSDARPVLLRPCSLTALRAALYLSPPPSNPRRLGTFCNGGMSASAELRRVRAVVQFFSTVSRALRTATHKSFHGFADGYSGCQGACSFPALFIRLRLHHPFSPAERT